MFEREIRDFDVVPRWTTFRSIQKQSLAEHSFYVAVYADQIAAFLGPVVDRDQLFRYALWHDALETITGDEVGPWKRRTQIHDRTQQESEKLLSVRFPGREWEKPPDMTVCLLVKAADCVEEALWLATEKQLGNRNVDALIDNALRKVRRAVSALPVTPDWQNALMSAIILAVHEHESGTSKYMWEP